MQTRRGRSFSAPFLLFTALICGACGDSSPQRLTEAQQPGKGTAFVSEEPRVFFLEVRSQDLEWTVTVSERLR